MTASGSRPSISASGLSSRRWRRMGGTTYFTSSGVTYSRPWRAAYVFAAIRTFAAARVLAPNTRSTVWRLAAAMRAMYTRIPSSTTID